MPGEGLTLLCLPREIREIVYRYIFNDRYCRDWPPDSPVTPASSLNILRTCTTIHAEASHTFYTRSIFWFRIPHQDTPELGTFGDLNTKRLMNIQIGSWMANREAIASSERLDKNLFSVISLFSGSSVPRSTFRILLYPSWRRVEDPESEVITALGTLTGFQSVVIQFVTMPVGRRIDPDTPWRNAAGIAGPVCVAYREKKEEGVCRVTQRLQAELGSGVIKDMDSKGVLYAREVEFRPRA